MQRNGRSGSVIWAMVVFFFWMMAIWIFISLFADIFRRNDLSGGCEGGMDPR